MVPGRDDLFLVSRMAGGFNEMTASRLLICDFHGNVIAGDGEPEATAFYIHARVQKNVPRAKAAFHTHMPNATALTMVEGPPLTWAIQSSLKFYGRTIVDEDYNGLALDEAEGDRIAASMGNADIVFMRNHGVLVRGDDRPGLGRPLLPRARLRSAASGGIDGAQLVPVRADGGARHTRRCAPRRLERPLASGEHQTDAGQRSARLPALSRAPHSAPLALLLVAGCTLIDQRTFAPSPEAKAQPPRRCLPARSTPGHHW